MSIYKNWTGLLEGQTEDTFDEFWKEYSDAETEVYKDILATKSTTVTGTLEALAAKYTVRPVIFMGFLDGISTSLTNKFNLNKITLETDITLEIDFSKLLFNMIKADADYLYTLDEWDLIFTDDEKKVIADEFRRSRTIVHAEPKVGRNDPCPCGSGKKYKKCCGK